MDRLDDDRNRSQLDDHSSADDARDAASPSQGGTPLADSDRTYEEEAAEAQPVAPEFTAAPTAFDAIRGDVDATDAIDASSSPERDLADSEARPGDAARKAELVGEGVGGVSGTLAGMALGTLAGPLGTVIGGIAGAIGGWWAGRAVADAAAGVTSDEDLAFRTHYESQEDRVADRPYEDVRAAYFLGYIAEANPEYAGRDFEEIEPDLERGWTNVRGKEGDWSMMRRYAREAYTRHRERTQRLGGTPRTMTPTEAARDRLHSDDTTL